MNVHAVISEFNPFHNGHKHLVDSIKQGGGAVVAVMSGSLVERGDVAVIDKYARAEAAVLSGVDLVLELPAPWCFAGAEFFALGGISVANGIGIVDTLTFGSESGDIDSLKLCAERLSSPEFILSLSAAREAHRDMGIAKLRRDVYEKLYGVNEHFNGSNDLLALEYIRALKRLGSDITPHAIKRIGEMYNSNELTEICSATAIRAALSDGIDKLSRYMPRESFGILLREITAGRRYELSRLDTAIIARLRTSTPEELSSTMEITAGMENRLTSLACKYRSTDELVSAAKGKHYSESRLRRAMIASLLGITMKHIEVPPLFTNVLAANSCGRELLGLTRKLTSITVLSKMSDANKLSGEAAEQYERHMKAERLCELCCANEPRRIGAVMI